MTDWQEMADKYMMTTYKRLPVTLVRGEGCRLWDDAGKEYLDFFGGHVVVSLGHCHPVVVKAVMDQAMTLMHYSNIVYMTPQVDLAQLLVDNSCFDRAFFCNSGAEANEAALKLARKWAKEHRGGAFEVICAENAFHGRTLATITAGGTERYKAPFTPLPEGFRHVPYNDAKAIERATSEKTCAVLLEPIQGEGGIIIPDDDYFQQVRAWCDEQNLLLILDEVQTGIGRTGALFGYQHFGIEPDIITLAKGLGGGFPIGAVLAKEHCAVFVPGDHGTTFGGNPLATRVGHAVVKYVLKKDVCGKAARAGEMLGRGLYELEDRFDFVTGVRGKGMLWGMEFRGEIAEEVMLACLEGGLVVNNVRPNVLRLSPPLIISDAELEQGLSVLERVLADRA
ncbi:MAG TPA: aspartate aminotransferase family protein [Dehalococcoidia bacterium]|nr:aspartate aminotransferase family protein [Dehalococcoidia bacterium]